MRAILWHEVRARKKAVTTLGLSASAETFARWSSRPAAHDRSDRGQQDRRGCVARAGVMKKLYAGEIPTDDLVLSKSSRKARGLQDHRTDVEPPFVGKYEAGERVEYFIRAGMEPLNKRAITREELLIYPLDYTYYAEKQLWNPIQRIMDLVVGRNVFQRRAITAPIRSGSMTKYVTVGPRKKKRRFLRRQVRPTAKNASLKKYFT